MIFDFDSEKNAKLRDERGISFEDVIYAIENEQILDVIPHHNQIKYPNQSIFVVEIEGYVYLVPFVHANEKFVLKTIFPSRKATKIYLEDRR